MQLFILTEGLQHTGYGHVARCLAIADSFHRRGVDIQFVVNGDEPVVSQLHAYPYQIFNWLDDLGRLKKTLQTADFVLIDSYLADLDIYEFIHEIVPYCIYMDDFNRLKYPSGILLNGTIGAEQLPYEFNDNHIYLVGKDYIILREPFRNIVEKRVIPRDIESVLITFGGSDPLNITLKVLSKLVEDYKDIKKNVILGAAFSHVDEIKVLSDSKTTFYYNVDAEIMKQLMLKADLAISAAGQTINELAIAGLPSIIFKIANNQDNNIKGWTTFGFIESFIDATQDWSVDDLDREIKRLSNMLIRGRISILGKQLIDGKGSERLVREVLCWYSHDNLTIAQASEKDMLFLFDLANEPTVRQNSFSTNLITLHEHTNWFYATLQNPNRTLYVFYVSSQFVGQVRLDLDEEGDVVISISLTPFFRGLKLAPFMLQMALREFKRERPTFKGKIYAYVKRDNKASKQTFLKAGFAMCENKDVETLKFVYI